MAMTRVVTTTLTVGEGVMLIAAVHVVVTVVVTVVVVGAVVDAVAVTTKRPSLTVTLILSRPMRASAREM